jgi:hypothetical protein
LSFSFSIVRPDASSFERTSLSERPFEQPARAAHATVTQSSALTAWGTKRRTRIGMGDSFLELEGRRPTLPDRPPR